MKAASVKEIKDELNALSSSQLLEFCMRLAKYKKDNKELLSYLLFYHQDEEGFLQDVINEIKTLFQDVNTRQLYLAKKTIRKIIRISHKYARYSSNKSTEASIVIYLIRSINELPLHKEESVALTNIYTSLVKKANTIISTFHEDLQYDFQKELKSAEAVVHKH